MWLESGFNWVGVISWIDFHIVFNGCFQGKPESTEACNNLKEKIVHMCNFTKGGRHQRTVQIRSNFIHKGGPPWHCWLHCDSERSYGTAWINSMTVSLSHNFCPQCGTVLACVWTVPSTVSSSFCVVPLQHCKVFITEKDIAKEGSRWLWI